MDKILEAGKIVTTHGIGGEIKIDVWCDSAEFLLELKTLYLSADKPLEIERSRVHKAALLAKFKGVNSIDDALPLLNKVVYFKKDEKKLSEGTYYIDDLVGLSVVDYDSNEVYGTIAEVFQTGANDVYTITDKAGKQFYMPAIAQVIKEVDIGAKTMTIKPIKGMFD